MRKYPSTLACLSASSQINLDWKHMWCEYKHLYKQYYHIMEHSRNYAVWAFGFWSICTLL